MLLIIGCCGFMMICVSYAVSLFVLYLYWFDLFASFCWMFRLFVLGGWVWMICWFVDVLCFVCVVYVGGFFVFVLSAS